MSDINKTIAILKQTLESMPSNIDVRLHLATLLLSVSDYKSAQENFELVLKEQSTNEEAILGMGKSCFYLKNYTDTRIFLGKLLKLKNDNNAEANLYMAKTYIELGDLISARNYYTKAINLDHSLADDALRSKLYDTVENNHNSNKLSNDKIKVYSEGYKPQEIADYQINNIDSVKFKDVGGLIELKEIIRHKIIYPFKNPEVFKAYGKKAGGGILLFGPPGCGKTFIAKATAGECEATFIPIGISDVLDMWLGESEKKLHEIFDMARRQAPSIIFIDEIDALGGSRQTHSTNSTKTLVNQLLSEMDGINNDNSQILIIGATNSPWFVDSALRRPGRFDRVVFVVPPDLPARIEILQLLTTNIKIEKIDFKKIAYKINGFSGADIKELIEIATEDAINNAFKTGTIRDITEQDFIKAVNKVKPSTKEWFSTAKNYATYANQSGVYDDILTYLKQNS